MSGYLTHLIQETPNLAESAVPQLNFWDLCKMARLQLGREGLEDVSGQVGALQETQKFLLSVV